MCLSRRGFFFFFVKRTTVLEKKTHPLDVVASVKSVQIRKKANGERCFPSRRTHTDPQGWTWSSFSGLRSCGAAAAPPSASTQLPPPTPHLLSLLHLCLKNTFLDTHKPSIPLPDPTEMHISVLKPCFSTVNCLEKDRCLCPFLIFHS